MKTDVLRGRIRVTSVARYSDEETIFHGMSVKRDNEHFNQNGISYVTVRCTANVCNVEPVKGQVWTVLGRWEERRKEGRRTNYYCDMPRELEMVIPEGDEEFKHFIAQDSKFVGIGIATAAKLFTEHDGAILDALSTGRLVDVLELEKQNTNRTLKPHHYQALYDGYRQYDNLKYARWFVEMRIPPSVQQRLFKFHGVEAVEEIKSDPYILQSFGLPFSKVDTLARDTFDVKPTDKRRYRAVVSKVLNEHCAKGGHTAISLELLLSKVKGLLTPKNLECESHRGSEAIIGIEEEVVNAIVSSKAAFDCHYEEETDTVHPVPLYIMESVVAKRFTNLLSSEVTWSELHTVAVSDAAKENPFALSEKQYQGVITSVGSNLSLLTGGAGTGKTTVLRTIARAYHKLGYDIHAMALSGRAAKRLNESIGFETSTIARFIKEKIKDVQDKSVVIIDESSMVDIYEMYRLVIGLSPDVRIILVGDPAQLPPINAGLVLSELLKLDFVPKTELDIVHRQSGSTGIPEYSKLVREYKLPPSLSYKRIIHHETLPKASALRDACVALMEEHNGVAQVLCPTNSLAKAVNKECQASLNSEGARVLMQFSDEVSDTGFRVGDPVIFTRNDYKLDVRNGTLARIVSLSKEEGSLIDVLLDDGRTISLKEIKDMQLGYAITLHKSQGSQFERVIVAVASMPMVDNAWFYTGVTRATSYVHLVGATKCIIRSIYQKASTLKRNVYLSQLMKNGYEGRK
ncbi:AAA family ATPase [Vibrio sp. 10N.286.49.F3]|uniref:AAA family ATPase n=1 Tax=Vibrio sp. 10N.286.49.F3 TaxID=3229704 RepID=UPI0035540163